MHLTVSICTWNRVSLLARSLASFESVRSPEGVTWELQVVNNRCTDHTDDVISSFLGRLPMRRLYEEKVGLSHSRNRAVEQGRGDYYVWTDDDVEVAPSWLEAYVAAFKEYPDAAVFGGPIEPNFEGRAPEFLVKGFDLIPKAYACLDLGGARRRFDAKTRPLGANYAIRRREQLEHPYDPRLGVRAAVRLQGEESVVLAAVLRRAEGWWVPEARVRHFIGKDRQTTGYLWKRYFGSGATSILCRGLPSGLKAGLFLARLCAGSVQRCVTYLVLRAVAGPREWIPALRDAARSAGALQTSFSIVCRRMQGSAADLSH